MSVKAFEIRSYGVKLPVKCIECCDRYMYVGTSDSYILQFFLDEGTTNGSSEQARLQCTKQRQKNLGTKRPVLTLKAAAAINRLLVLSDNTIYLLNSIDLEFVTGAPKIKGVINFCVNQDPLSSNPFDVEICVAKRRSLQIYNVTETKAQPVKDVSIPETPNAMAMDGKYVCLALPTKYTLVDCERNSLQEILPYDNTITNPIILRINNGEFLLNGPNALGVFVTTACTSERPPIAWSTNTLKSIAFTHPYVVALDAQSLLIYSVLDYKQKQKISLVDGILLDSYDGRLLGATADGNVYGLVSVPLQRQVQDLLDDGKTDEALDLANHYHWPGYTKEQFKKIYRRFQLEAGFIEFSKFRFDRARELFIEGELDPRELIILYPGLLPATTSFTRSAFKTLHGISNITQFCKDEQERINECWSFLIGYLGDIRETQNYNMKLSKDVEVALIKLYAEFNPSELIAFIVASDLSEHLAECAEWLERYGRQHALALLHSRHGHPDKALDIWLRLLNSDEETNSDEESHGYFPGLPFVVEFLANLDDTNLLWKCADAILSKDQELGVKIFTERPRSCDNGFSSAIKAEAVTDFLQQYPKALVKYLEYLVFTSNDKKENVNTHLAILYLDDVLQIIKSHNFDHPQLRIARQKLQHMLGTSSAYRFHFLLAKLQNTELHLETALVYGKLEEHDKGLRLLVHKSNDPKVATEYCQHYSKGRDIHHRQKLFHTLLGAYLDPALTVEQQDALFQPAISLINNELAEFEATAVLKLLPDHWSASIVDQFLLRAMRRAMDTRRTKRIEKSLAKTDNVRTRFDLYSIQKDATIITEETICSSCWASFTDPEFVRFANGDLLHPHCARQMDIHLDDDQRSETTVEQNQSSKTQKEKPRKPPTPVR